MFPGTRSFNRNCRNLIFLFVGLFLTLQLWYSGQACINDPIFNIQTNYSSHPVSPMATRSKPFLIESKTICDAKRLKILILVHSSTTHFKRREAFRQTWANKGLFSGNDIRVAFVLGTNSKPEVQTQIEAESERNGDIVQGDFSDTYVNLTHKAIAGLRWVNSNCRQAEIIVKVDDDVFLNVYQLYQRVDSEFQFRQRHIWCHMLPERTDKIPREGTKWDVPMHEFSQHSCYPFTFCRGYVVIFTRDLVSSLVEKSQSTPFFHLDDVFVYGLLAAKLEHVTHEYLEHMTVDENESTECYFRKGTCPYFVTRVENPNLMPEFWSRLQSHTSKPSSSTNIIPSHHLTLTLFTILVTSCLWL